MFSHIKSSNLLQLSNTLSNIDEVLIPGSKMLQYNSIDAPEFIPSTKPEFIPFTKPEFIHSTKTEFIHSTAKKTNSLDFILDNKIDMNPRPFLKKSRCHKDKECTKSICIYSHDISWYKREFHFIRIYNEHQKEIKSIIDFKIPMFPKLIPHYEEILNYHNELANLAYKYAEIYKNDMSYLLDYKEKSYTNECWNKLGEKYRFETKR
jgi:hypothetical protein